MGKGIFDFINSSLWDDDWTIVETLTKKQRERSVFIIEENNFFVGNTKEIESNRTILPNESGDTLFADNPSDSELKANGLSKFDIERIHVLNEEQEIFLEVIFKGVLSIAGDIGIELGNHFVSGQGADFMIGKGKSFSSEIKNSKEILSFKKAIERELALKFKNYGSIKPLNNYTFKTDLPQFKFLESSKKNAEILLGGLQRAEIYYKISLIDDEVIKVEVNRITLYDTFGAGYDDGGQNDLKQWFPGLLQMFVLQHYKNTKNNLTYRPFTFIIDLHYEK